jgi:hypothetical protein
MPNIPAVWKVVLLAPHNTTLNARNAHPFHLILPWILDERQSTGDVVHLLLPYGSIAFFNLSQ